MTRYLFYHDASDDLFEAVVGEDSAEWIESCRDNLEICDVTNIPEFEALFALNEEGFDAY